MKLIKTFFKTFIVFFRENYTYRASALAYTSLLGLVPLLAVIVFFITKFPLFSFLTDLSKEYMLKNFVPESAHTSIIYFQNFIQQAARLPTISILFLIVTVLLMIDMIEDIVNDIWQIKIRRTKLRAVPIYLLIIFFTPVFMGLTVFLTSLITTLTKYIDTNFLSVSVFLLSLLPILINTLIFSLIYIYAPHTRVSRKKGFIGGLLAAIFFEITRIGFAFYLTKFANYQVIYGAFAVFPIFLIWLFLCWFIFLWGALFTYIYSKTLP